MEGEGPMQHPVTELDPRFSEPNAVATDWEETRRVLEGAEFFWITTVRVDGRPHVTPLVAVWLDDAIYFATGTDEQKAVNLRSNQNVSLTTGCNEWERDWTWWSRARLCKSSTRVPSNNLRRRGRRNGTGAGTTRYATAPSGTRVRAARCSSSR